MASDDETITFQVQQDYPHQQVLSFPPPYADLALNPEGFAHWWRKLMFVFDLPDPHQFPPLPIQNAEDMRRIERYVATCRELARSTILNHPGSLTLTAAGTDQELTVVSDSAPAEAVRGGVVLFRQVASDNEQASYSRVRNIIGRAIQEAPDQHRDQQLEWNARWNRARGKLNAFDLQTLVEEKFAALRGAPPGFPLSKSYVRPLVLIKQFQYGDLLHWGDTRDQLAELRQSEVQYELSFFDFIASVIQLSHLFLGYSVLAARTHLAEE